MYKKGISVITQIKERLKGYIIYSQKGHFLFINISFKNVNIMFPVTFPYISLKC